MQVEAEKTCEYASTIQAALSRTVIRSNKRPF